MSYSTEFLRTGPWVESEYAPLRSVVVAQCEVALPARLDGDGAVQGFGFLPEGSSEMAVRMMGQSFEQAYPELHRAWRKERETLCDLLRGYGVEVLRPRLLDAAEKAQMAMTGYASFFVRDPWFTVGNFVIEGCMRLPHRRAEIRSSRPILDQRAMTATCNYVACPAGDDRGAALRERPAPYLEGGDVLVRESKIYVGVSGWASSMLGVQWLRKLLEPAGFDVEAVPLHPDVLHLDCALSLVREGLMIVCEEALPQGLPDDLRSWDAIEVTLEQARQLAVNGLPVSPSVYVTDPAFQEIGARLRRHGVQVEYVDFALTRRLGGAFRCSTQPLLRI
jgi:N-dimethylarginine dimethylaminohydrolase